MHYHIYEFLDSAFYLRSKFIKYKVQNLLGKIFVNSFTHRSESMCLFSVSNKTGSKNN
uniref:Uncharacterized protein n=1 Tax=Octopus bimaculoides TaxID=37653 RepID=A0A0L8HPN7_OCTBM